MQSRAGSLPHATLRPRDCSLPLRLTRSNCWFSGEELPHCFSVGHKRSQPTVYAVPDLACADPPVLGIAAEDPVIIQTVDRFYSDARLRVKSRPTVPSRLVLELDGTPSATWG
jgi:hypothetical protein